MNLTSVGITAGVPTSGTGTVSTIDALMAIVATAAKQPALGTAGSAATDVISVQGIASGTAMGISSADGGLVTLGSKADAKSTATDTTAITLMQVGKQISASVQAMNTALGSTALDLGSGTGGSRTLRTFIDTSQVPTLGQATMSGSIPVTIASDQGTQVVSNTYLTEFGTGYYVTVAASQTATVLQSSTGATGDYISGILVIPASTSPGNVLLLDNSTSITVFAGGSSSVGSLVPFFIPLGAVSRSGAWKITTGANVSVVAIGKFS